MVSAVFHSPLDAARELAEEKRVAAPALAANGTKTAEIDDSKLASGPIALQWGRGTIKFRKVQVKSI